MNEEYGELIWVRCPVCGQGTIKIWKATKTEKLPIYCRKCKRIVKILNIPA
ncbi:MAG: hypothetical protein HFF44_04940 [Lawsonibacter sp.]|nr:hypothetical protein [Lawsonibacter sp.]